MRVISVIGITESGKTTTIENIIGELKRRNYTVGSVKEIHFEEFQIDTEGSNTYRHKMAGSELVTARGYYETDILFQEKLSMDKILSFYDHDFVILEGVAEGEIPKIIAAHDIPGIEIKMDNTVFAISGRIAGKISEYKGLPAINSLTDIEELVDLIEEKTLGQNFEDKSQNEDINIQKNRESKPIVDMKQHILTVASGLISELGINETSLKRISEEAGISKGTLYYHYSAKEDIIYDIADRNLKQITDELLAWVEDADADLLAETILKTLFENILAAETRAKLHLYLLNDAITANNSLAKKFEKRYNDWRETLLFGINKVLPKNKADNLALSYLILALLDGLIIQKMFTTKNIPLDEIIDIIINVNKTNLSE